MTFTGSFPLFSKIRQILSSANKAIISNSKLDETYIKRSLKCDSFDVTIDFNILFFRVLVTIEAGRSLLQFVTTKCLISFIKIIVLPSKGYEPEKIRMIFKKKGGRPLEVIKI